MVISSSFSIKKRDRWLIIWRLNLNIYYFFFLKQKANVKVKPKTPASVPDMYILIGIGELKCIIEVDRHVKTY